MALKQVNRSATVAFAPMGNLMACGTQAGAIDLAFSSSACLELFKLDFTTSDLEPPLLGTAPSTERFHRLTWGTAGIEDGTYPYGIVAGGLVDGSLNLWNPAKLTSGRSDNADAALIKKLQNHQGAVRGLEFNVFSPNLLASGAEDGNLCIWDLSNPTAPSLYPELKGPGGVQAQAGEISYLSWNHKVQHILASTSFSGTSVVWDLRKQKPVLSFTDPTSRRRCSTLQWSPDVATQLVVASDDDRSPSLQVWDLRNSVSPARELSAHSKGVLAMAWCPSDSTLLLTCAKDNRTFCWDMTAGEVLYELPASNNWNFDLKWNPRIPGVLSTSSFDGKISLYNIESRASSIVAENDFAAVGDRRAAPVARRAPNWLKRPVGASFGFGGKLVSFSPRRGAAAMPGAPPTSEVRIDRVMTEAGLVQRSAKFEASVAGAEKDAMRAFCQNKSASATGEDEKETWSFLGVLFEEDARRKLLAHLSFSSGNGPLENGPDTMADVQAAADALAAGVEDLSVKDAATSNGTVTPPQPVATEAANPDEFFDNLQTPQTPPAHLAPSVVSPDTAGSKMMAGKVSGLRVSTVDEEPDAAAAAAAEEEEEQSVSEEEAEVEKEIQRALVVGNYELAVQHCLASKRMADALVLASVGGASLWASVQNEFMRRNRRPYMKVVAAVVNNDMKGLVLSRPLSEWKETLALLCTYARSEEWTGLCDELGGRLDAAGNTRDAVLCFICAGSIDRAVEIWSRSISIPPSTPSAVDALQDVMEKAVVLGMATGQKRESGALAKLVGSYAELLASQGRLATAMDYLALVPGDRSSQELAVLRDRIYRSGQISVGPTREAPPFPFEAQELRPEPAPTAPMYAAPAAPTNAYGHAMMQPQQQQQQQQASNMLQHHQQPQHQHQHQQDYDFYQQQQQQQQQMMAPPPPATQFTPSFVPAPMAPPPVTTFMPSQPPLQQPPAPTTFMPQQHQAQPQQAPPPPRAPTAFVPAQPTPTPAPFVPAPVPAPFVPVQPPPTYQQQQQQHFQQAPPPQPMQPLPTAVAAAATAAHQQAPRGFVPVPTTVPSAAANFSHQPQQQQPSQPQPPTAMAQQQQQQPATPVSPPAAATPAAPPAPPPTVQTADTSSVPVDLKPIVASLTRLYNETLEGVGGGARANPAKKREVEDNSRKLGALFTKLNAADVSPNVAGKLQQLCQALDSGDFATALHIQVALTTSDWDECSAWITALRRMIKARQSLR